MTSNERDESGPFCPLCGKAGPCPHWIGWTEDGKTVELLAMVSALPVVQRGDWMTNWTKSGPVAARVYRPVVANGAGGE
jgi:hypothetical protein